ncbi:MAG: RIP metalloprotease RseP [Deltaproteobacteria bacterium]|nr:RIP metalloprotease RseP [Deltaproteobacteria bacterium]
MTTAWSFLLVLTGIILVHEFGHFIVARGFGIRVLKFSVGIGPRVCGVVRGATDYCISAFPLGGFVKMLGEQPDEEVPPEERPWSFSHKPAWQRAFVVAAGPVFNFIFAWLIFFVIFLAYGKPVILTGIGEVQPGSPAEKAGVMAGDRITAIDGRDVHRWEEVSEAIKANKGDTIVLTLQRDRTTVSVDLIPKIYELKNIFGEEVKVPMIGVSASGDFEIEKLNPLTATGQAFSRTWELIVLTGQVIVKLIERVIPLSTLGGPIMIAQMAGQQAELGILNLFYFMALLSINIGFLNLLPIPVLDGGHLAFLAIEGITKRPLTMRQKAIAQQIGIFILLALMVVIFYNDIARLLGFIPSG